MKKCPRCDSISADADATCGVCGGSLSGVTSGSLEQLVQQETRLKPKKKSNVGALALVVFGLATTVAGAALLFINGIGIVLLLVGLVAILVIAGGAGGPLKRGGGIQRRRSMTSGQQEVRSYAEKRKRRTGEKD